MALDIRTCKRNENFIKESTAFIDKQLIAKKKISLLVPVTLVRADLLTLDERIYTLGSICYTDGKSFSNMNLVCTIELGMTEHKKVMVVGFSGKEVECYEFEYDKGDIIHPTNEVPVDSQILGDTIDHHLMMGKPIPYFDTTDVCNELDSVPRFCKIGVPEFGFLNHFSEMTLRSADDLQMPARLSNSKKFTVIPFKSIILNVGSNLGKNNGAYLEDGIMQTSVTTSESVTPFEAIVRS